MAFGKKKPKILIIEDNQYSLEIYATEFKNAGFEVIISPDAEGDLLDAVLGAKPNIISMDLMIAKDNSPEARDGFEAIELLKGDLRTHEIPIFVLSNFFEEGKAQKARSLGVIDYINAAAYTPKEITQFYQRYLEDPKHYKPSHPLLR